MALINCKVKLPLNWIEDCIFTVNPDANNNINKSTFKITDAKLCYFKNWNEYKVISNKIVEIAAENEEKYMRELLNSSWQGVKRLFVLAYNDTAGNNQVSIDSFRKYFLPKVKIEIHYKLHRNTLHYNKLQY